MKKTITLVLVLALGLVTMSLAAEDTWTTKADMPTARWGLSTSVVNGKIYAIGGQYETYFSAFSTVEVYDPATDTWSRAASMPTERVGLATSVVNGRIYAIGGVSRGSYCHRFKGAIDELKIYDSCWNVLIDIKPGSYPNSINLGSHGVIPVAILSSDYFDASTVDPTSVTLAGAGVAVRGKGKSLSHEEDVNGERGTEQIPKVVSYVFFLTSATEEVIF